MACRVYKDLVLVGRVAASSIVTLSAAKGLVDKDPVLAGRAAGSSVVTLSETKSLVDKDLILVGRVAGGEVGVLAELDRVTGVKVRGSRVEAGCS